MPSAGTTRATTKLVCPSRVIRHGAIDGRPNTDRLVHGPRVQLATLAQCKRPHTAGVTLECANEVGSIVVTRPHFDGLVGGPGIQCAIRSNSKARHSVCVALKCVEMGPRCTRPDLDNMAVCHRMPSATSHPSQRHEHSHRLVCPNSLLRRVLSGHSFAAHQKNICQVCCQ